MLDFDKPVNFVCKDKMFLNDEENDGVEILDLVDRNRSTIPTVALQVNSRHVVYIDKYRYDCDLLVGQRTVMAAYAQLQRDITRCEFAMNGVVTSHIPRLLSSQLVRYCTQSVLALPVEMLTTARVMVCESGERMRVSATPSSVCVTKLIYATTPCLTRNVDVAIVVRAELAQPFVEVIFEIVRRVTNVPQVSSSFTAPLISTP